MSNKKEDKDMQTQAVRTEVIDDMKAVMSLKQVHNYTDRHVERGHAEYHATGIKVKSKHPLDELVRRGMIGQEHYDSGKRIMTIRDCAFSRSAGRIYNDVGEGESGIDAMTLYTVTHRIMKRPTMRNAMSSWQWIEIICFAKPDIDGKYLDEADYRAIYAFAPNIQHAFEELNKAIAEAREDIKERIKRAEAAISSP
jgi:hypothetical protein